VHSSVDGPAAHIHLDASGLVVMAFGDFLALPSAFALVSSELSVCERTCVPWKRRNEYQPVHFILFTVSSSKAWSSESCFSSETWHSRQRRSAGRSTRLLSLSRFTRLPERARM
jgi:hypothetical protein